MAASAAAAKAGTVIGSKGQSSSWLSRQASVFASFDEFLTSTASGLETRKTWAVLTESELIDPALYEQWSGWLYDHIIADGEKNAGQHLQVNVALSAVSIMLHRGANKYGKTGSDAAKLFFTCLIPKGKTEAALWLQVVRRNTVRMFFVRAMDSGGVVDFSATPLYST